MLISKRVFISNQPFWDVSVTDDAGHVGEIKIQVWTGGSGNNGNNGTLRTAFGPAIRVDNNAWHHVVLLLDRDAGITVYVDGASRYTAGAFTGNMSNAGEFLLGKSTNLFAPVLQGRPRRGGALRQPAEPGAHPGALHQGQERLGRRIGRCAGVNLHHLKPSTTSPIRTATTPEWPGSGRTSGP